MVVSDGKSTRANGYLDRLENELEHALSAYHEKLPHGAGPIMISKAYYSHFVERHACDEKFIEMAQNARDTLGPNFLNDPCPLSDEDCVNIYQKSFR